MQLGRKLLSCYFISIKVEIYLRMQEIPTGVMETAKSFIKIDDWAKIWIEILKEKGFYLVILKIFQNLKFF